MAIIRYQRPENGTVSPFRRMSTLRDEIDQVFDRMFQSPWDLTQASQFMAGWSPAIDLYEDKDNLVVKAELPGMKKEDIEITLQDGLLSVSGERKEEKKEESAETYRSERYVGRFQRTFSLPSTVNEEQITASYKDGVLTVTLPKSEEAKPKQIAVSVK
jgi:HSP20 family protein